MTQLRYLLLLSLVLLLLPTASAQDAVNSEVVGLLNQARREAGLHPLMISSALVRAAQRHSADMAANEMLSHTGSDGSEFWQRMQDAGYVLTAGAENVLSRSDADGAAAFQQWYDSPAHRENMMNPEYVEVGVAFARSSSGTYYFTMLLGAREGVEPPPADSGEVSASTATPADTSPPPTAAPTATPARAAASPTPRPVDRPSNTPAPVLPTATATIPPTATVQITRDARVGTIVAPLATNTQSPDRLLSPVEPTPIETIPMPSPTQEPVDIRLDYDASVFTLTNVSGRILNLRGLTFETRDGQIVMPASRWDTEFLTQSLGGFTPDDCLQFALPGEAAPRKPDDCRYRHAWLVLRSSEVFWDQADSFFYVRRDGQVVGFCDTDRPTCAVNLSSQLDEAAAPETPAAPTASPVSQAQESGQPGLIWLLIADTGIVLYNASDEAVDVSELVFESDNGVYAAAAWETPDLSQPLTALPAGDCLHVWAVGEEYQPKPSICDFRHSWVAVPSQNQFWAGVNVFRVRLGVEVLATCETRTTECRFTLPGR